MADSALSSLGVSNSSAWALVHLLRLGDEVRQGDLARVINVTEPSLVRTLHLLEDAGLVERHADDSDRRAKHLRLTEEGSIVAKRIDKRLIELRATLLDGIPTEDVETVVRVLDRIAARIAESAARQ
ncbi:MarR family transcriptional regulator [Novosphingobium aerophilum]|uniref:MarR family transcriptional regulator n=1 Tax=Novosphingobium TaxID=165696 RepID=UPI0010E362CD|nr:MULTISPECIES: MarR family transcriptional regulator [unclassified Novosphingobium]TCM32508.1 MarR family transcriptional regulator for hemolysin [Novosphingobium sp. ST904]WRT91820.1 MarR family transcriptional regulator [Novosphingobium sp. RL4]